MVRNPYGQVIDRQPIVNTGLKGQVIDRFAPPAPPVGRFPGPMPPQFGGQVIDRQPVMGQGLRGQVIDRAPQFAGPGMVPGMGQAPLTAGLRNWPAWTGYGRR